MRGAREAAVNLLPTDVQLYLPCHVGSVVNWEKRWRDIIRWLMAGQSRSLFRGMEGYSFV